MPKRTFKSEACHGDDQTEENSPHCSSVRLDTETNNSTEEEFNEISLRIENEITGKMEYEIRKAENNILKALSSLSQKSLSDDHSSSSTEITSDGENMILVQPASHGLDSDQDNIDPMIIMNPLSTHNQTFITTSICREVINTLLVQCFNHCYFRLSKTTYYITDAFSANLKFIHK